mmetsp:Transcript_70944/g.154131  ORF Transcript_70944/g.154131 Transcript_70944/m.154131 type:complete len:242 (-) Transcript_70944:67-792(-)|eukprot:CAMPEP_0170612938 /NCGR_PEP_ID=MMETSP0224-20130122/23997_1 /TAXON_ID=285029 /ORGANISM="Togula jolla, Strain CCCM 725" /LENGTH=241 /DNA_ID=CAMNT_0010938489 /DNA_START=29 /DNA_END=754 /DNA_ORIENTATION=+
MISSTLKKRCQENFNPSEGDAKENFNGARGKDFHLEDSTAVALPPGRQDAILGTHWILLSNGGEESAQSASACLRHDDVLLRLRLPGSSKHQHHSALLVRHLDGPSQSCVVAVFLVHVAAAIKQLLQQLRLTPSGSANNSLDGLLRIRSMSQQRQSACTRARPGAGIQCTKAVLIPGFVEVCTLLGKTVNELDVIVAGRSVHLLGHGQLRIWIRGFVDLLLLRSKPSLDGFLRADNGGTHL